MLAHIRSYGSLGRLQSDGATEWMGKNWNMNSIHMPNVLNENFVVSFEVNFEKKLWTRLVEKMLTAKHQ